MNIALDVMGGDHAPAEIVAGAVEAARAYGVTISLVGIPDLIRVELAKHATSGLKLPIVPASQVIGMDEKPATAVRSKTDSSMVVAMRLVHNGDAQAFVTAGNTGGALAGGILHIGRIKSILRPALVTPFPTRQGFCTILDVGANVDVRPEHIQQFAVMGRVYSQHIMGVPNPNVYLLSNGEEEGKGNQLVVNTYQLLSKTPGINFRGNIESKDTMQGLADVVVTDGFTGNIFIKTAEALARMLQDVMVEELTSGPISTVGAFLAQAALRRVRLRVDDTQYGGAVLLGLSGIVVVAHGRSKATAIRHAIRVAKQSVELDIPGKIQAGVVNAIQSTDSPVTEPVR